MRLVSTLALLVALCPIPAGAGPTAAGLARGFQSPPASARPWVYWFWLNGNITREGITADLEAMKRVGIGGVLIMEVDQGTPLGPVAFAGEQWRSIFRHVVSEAARLGLKVNMNNDAGWCGSGGPWITPELAMQRLVWIETSVDGPGQLDRQLPRPVAVAGYYRDVAVLAYPTPADPGRIAGVNARAVADIVGVSLPTPVDVPTAPAARVVPEGAIVDLTQRMDRGGRLQWDVPPGRWTILRLGHTPTGANNAPSPESGRGLECDKLSKAASRAMFEGLMGKLVADVGPLAGKALVSTHIDSWEVGVQNWTPKMREEFRSRRGYDPLAWLPVITGRTVGGAEQSERFLWDWRQTISELVLDNYAGAFRALAHEHGIGLSIEAYNTCPTDEMAYAGRADEPMGEFWSWGKYGAAYSVREMASAGHVYGKPIIGAEAFTAADGEAWQGYPGNIKDLGDWAFCEGINRFVFHRYALQPWRDVRPGMSMGPWGLHYERTQTWWEQSSAWHRYLSRCQYLLQQGLFVADTCLLGPEGSPQSVNGQASLASLERPPYNFDVCPPDAALTRMSVRAGRLVMPDGMSYRLLALPRVEAMTPRLLRKVRDLVRAGATVAGPRPRKSPGLSGFPGCDAEVRRMAAELWGSGPTPAGIAERRVGKGRVIWGSAFLPSQPAGVEPRLAGAEWVWYPEGRPDVFAPPARRYFVRGFDVPDRSAVRTAKLAITADNEFQVWLNGRLAGEGNAFNRVFVFDVAGLLLTGANTLAVVAVNATDLPNPAGLIASLEIRLRSGQVQAIRSGRSWRAASAVPAGWPIPATQGTSWADALELGPLGMAPWGDVEAGSTASNLYPDLDLITRLHRRMGLPPDFGSRTANGLAGFRYIHKVIAGNDVYFLSNKEPRAVEAVCSFRPSGKRPELWWPDTGRTERPAIYDTAANGTIRMPVRLGPSGSVFVVFPAGEMAEPNRIVRVERAGAPVTSAVLPPAVSASAATSSAPSRSFTLAVWVRPGAPTTLVRETNRGISGQDEPRNDALYPAPGHEAFGDWGSAGVGLAVGSNGVCVFEHGADHFAPVLVWPARLNTWTHVAVVYRDGVPALYLNGRKAHVGLSGPLVARSGLGVAHGRPIPPFAGELGLFRQVGRALSDAEVALWARSMPRPKDRAPDAAVAVTRDATGRLVVDSSTPGAYTLHAADGSVQRLVVPGLPSALTLHGPWEVKFAKGWGAPDRIDVPALASLNQHADAGVRHYSGVASYTTSLAVPAGLLAGGRRIELDLGVVAVMADVTLNGRKLGTLWHAPFRLDVTSALRSGPNVLKVDVANLWVNRQIGDESLPEDSDRTPSGTLRSWPEWLQQGQPSPTGRFTFTSWRLWHGNSPLVESGLVGPVKLEVVQRVVGR
jgi:hypothetical protein